MSSNSLNALVKFYLDQIQVRRDNNSNDFAYPAEKDIFNRESKDWTVFDIDVKSKVSPYMLKENEIRSSKFTSPWKKEAIAGNVYDNNAIDLADTSIQVYLIDLYFYAYNAYPFVFKFYDLEGRIIQEASATKSVFTLTIDGYKTCSYVKFTGPSEATRSEVYLSEDSLIPFYSVDSNVIDSRAMMEEHKFLPVRLFGKNGEELKNIVLEYKRNYASYPFSRYTSDSTSSYYRTLLENVLKITMKDKSSRIETDVEEVEIVFGAEASYDSSSFIYSETSETVEDIGIADFYFYFGEEELGQELSRTEDKIEGFADFSDIKNENDTLKVIFDESNEDMFRIECLELAKNVKFFELDKSLVKDIFTEIEVDSISSSNRNLIVRKSQLIVDKSIHERIYNVDQELEELSLKQDDGSWKELDFKSFEWKVNLLQISLAEDEQDFSNKTLKFIFKTRALTLDKKDLEIFPDDKTSHPFILLFEEDENGERTEIENSFFYIHNQKTRKHC